MAYTINKTDGTTLATITDGTIDNSTSLILFGKSYSGFGEALNENLVKLLENAASTSAPTAPIAGELWWDKTSTQLKVYDGTAWKPAGAAKSQSAQPTGASSGDLWKDSDTQQVYVYTGSAWLLVGPTYTSTQTLSGWQIETLASSGGDKVVSSMYAGNTRVCIVSKELFTPSVSQTGFATIKIGLTLNSTLGAVFEGTNTQAKWLDVSSTTNDGALVAAGNMLRADAADTTTGAITIDADGGVVIGDAQEFSITVSSSNVTMAQVSSDKDLSITVNDGGVTKTSVFVDSSSAYVGIWNTTPAAPLDITGDVKITGNLSITGEYTQLSSAINLIENAFIKLNAGNSEVDSGMIVETSDTDDARLFYQVSTNNWVAGENQTYSQVITLADAVTDGDATKSAVLKTTAGGNVKVTSATLGAVGTISEGDTSNVNVPTIGAVVTFGDKWGGSEKTVSTSAPTSGDGSDGDLWFVRES